MSFYTMSNSVFIAMSNKISDTEADSEGQNSTPLPYGWRLPQPNNFSCDYVMSSPPMYRAQSTLAPFPDAISALAPMPDYLSTGAPRQVILWRRRRSVQFAHILSVVPAAKRMFPSLG
ncbi:unnamed protein product [Penicillium discolor]